jgi:hypothetical protein
MNIQKGTGWKFKRKITKNLSLIHGITTLIVSSKLSDSGSGETIDHPEDPSWELFQHTYMKHLRFFLLP